MLNASFVWDKWELVKPKALSASESVKPGRMDMMAKYLSLSLMQAPSFCHRQREGRVNPKCGGKLYFIDVAISRAYGGFLGAWQCVDGQVSAIYPDMTETMPDMVVSHVAEDADNINDNIASADTR